MRAGGATRAGRLYVRILVVCLILLSGIDVHGQTPSRAPSLRQWFAKTDSTLLFDLYSVDQPVVTGYLRGAHWTAVPITAASGPALALGEWISGSREWERPAAVLAAQGTGYLLQYGFKRLIGRPRPYAVYAAIDSRSSSHPNPSDRFAMPSGHATLTFATASSLSLAYPYWYVVAPSVVWAGGVALSRPWLGVHYPSDIVAGALLGTAVGIVVHLVVPEILPAPLK